MILIVSATKGENYVLSEKIKKLLEFTQSELISLEDYRLPLFIPNEQLNKQELEIVTSLKKKFSDSKGVIYSLPEYNGGVPPIVSNTLAHISVNSEKNWREVFTYKPALIATHSGGPANRLLTSFRSQLEHLGHIVHPRTLSTTYSSEIDLDSAKNILKSFVSLLKF